MSHSEAPPSWAMEKARESVAEILRQDGFVDADISDVLSGIKDELHGIAIFARALAEADKAATERAAKIADALPGWQQPRDVASAIRGAGHE